MVVFLKDTLIKKFVNIQEELDNKIDNNDKILIKQLKQNITNKLLFAEHHQSHAASAFFPSPFKEAAVITMDGVGEWATTTVAIGKGNNLEIKKEIHFPHSLGLLYSAFTYYTGFKVNSGEYKLMGLAPYGIPDSDQVQEYIKTIKEQMYFLNMFNEK